jgi:hypothetical protein
MPVYMDRHYVEGATRHALADAHQRDITLQDKYDVKFLTYWFDEERCTAFCLVEAPDRETIERAHCEAHGLVPNEVLEVDPNVVDAFLGRIKDPVPAAGAAAGENPVDAGFRTIMFYGFERLDTDDEPSRRRQGAAFAAYPQCLDTRRASQIPRTRGQAHR